MPAQACTCMLCCCSCGCCHAVSYLVMLDPPLSHCPARLTSPRYSSCPTLIHTSPHPPTAPSCRFHSCRRQQKRRHLSNTSPLSSLEARSGDQPAAAPRAVTPAAAVERSASVCCLLKHTLRKQDLVVTYTPVRWMQQAPRGCIRPCAAAAAAIISTGQSILSLHPAEWRSNERKQSLKEGEQGQCARGGRRGEGKEGGGTWPAH